MSPTEAEACENLDAECEQLRLAEEAMRADEHWLDIRVPTPEERTSEKSSPIGTFEYPDSSLPEYRDDYGCVSGDYAEDCRATEENVRAAVYEFLNDHYIDTTDAEIRLSEHAIGEIRVYW